MKISSSMIDKDLRATGRLMRVVSPTFSELGLRLIHKLASMRRVRVEDAALQVIGEWAVRGDGSRLRLCVFRPLTPRQDVPGVLWLHGGGYAIGTPEQAQGIARRLVEVSNCVVVAPDYRLSVEAPYPAALEDSYDALLWMKSHAAALGVRDDQLMVGGDSAGGGLAAALTQVARDRGEVSIAFQLPLYPMLDDRMTSESATDNDAPVWNSKSNAAAWKLYLGSLYGTDRVPAYAAAARATDYAGLPPAVTFVGDLEPFRDETIAYVENLRNAGVPVDFELYPGCYHGFDQVCPNAPVSRKANAFVVSAFRYAVEHYRKPQPR